jgi:two-component system sensor histidine kinase HydH
MRRTRLALVATPLLVSAALLATLVGTYVAVRGASETLVLGQGDAILDSLAHHPGDRLETGFLANLLAEQSPEGLRCIAVFDRDLASREVAGDCLAGGPDELRQAILGVQAHEVLEVDDRVRMTRGLPRGWDPASGEPLPPLPRDPVLVEFEPLMRRDLEAGALRSLGIGGLASLAFVVLAVGLWRFSLRQERLEAAMERDRRLASLGEMAAVLAHEIRNPLASMKGHAQLLAERLEPDTPERAKADRVVGEAVRLEQLTGDLLSFIRSENIERRTVDPREVVEAAARDVDPSRVTLDATGAPDSWSLDPRLLEQALANLLRNALQSSDDEEMATVSLAADHGHLVLAVRDRGPGVPESDRERIFEPFYTTRVKGTGLGLAVARRIVGLHGGELTTSNHPDGGAVFRITLPSR